ncbi:methionine ABC transporter permease [Saccharothrix algeriensis]|uniref:ABC transporter permease subunit n=1 Tax=Saccharothrix algeriensis TaxID=173560 RepID=A0A8T8I395_9PSEU|nr:ABC transporter permease subunit [Saccharothrix algeriensis]MBM7811549.1 D-methionine transport system permease protein [Saccharothrix algeriensis]QTR05363.1 ABC transporter permease subunit [Saccharothrix algeriensis]
MRSATPWSTVLDDTLVATGGTLYMVGVSTLIAVLLGTPLGVWLQLTAPGGLRPSPVVHKLVGFVVDLGRSMPFLVLLVLLTSVTRLLVGTTAGPSAAVVPLAIGAIPFVGRLVQNVLSEVHVAAVEAAVTTGASILRIVRSVLLRESFPALVNAIGVTAIALLGYSAMAGVVGGGGLGDLAVRQGYQRFDDRYMLATVAVLAVIATLIQFTANRVARAVDRRRHATV